LKVSGGEINNEQYILSKNSSILSKSSTSEKKNKFVSFQNSGKEELYSEIESIRHENHALKEEILDQNKIMQTQMEKFATIK
jgi:hypothetical protein